MNLSDWADQAGVSKYTAYGWFKEGILPVPARRTGRLILVEAVHAPSTHDLRTVLYARVSSRD